MTSRSRLKCQHVWYSHDVVRLLIAEQSSRYLKFLVNSFLIGNNFYTSKHGFLNTIEKTLKKFFFSYKHCLTLLVVKMEIIL